MKPPQMEPGGGRHRLQRRRADGVYESHILQRHFQDIHVISQHLQARHAHYELVGRQWLWLPIDEARV